MMFSCILPLAVVLRPYGYGADRQLFQPLRDNRHWTDVWQLHGIRQRTGRLQPLLGVHDVTDQLGCLHHPSLVHRQRLPRSVHHGDTTEAARRIKSPATQLFVQQLTHTTNNKNIQTPHRGFYRTGINGEFVVHYLFADYVLYHCHIQHWSINISNSTGWSFIISTGCLLCLVERQSKPERLVL